jgi:hypothetical protein
MAIKGSNFLVSISSSMPLENTKVAKTQMEIDSGSKPSSNPVKKK